MKRKLFAICIISLIMLLLIAVPAFALQGYVSFSVNPSYNYGNQWSAPNPKDDDEQRSYYVTQGTNAVYASGFFYATTRVPVVTESYHVTTYRRVSGTGTLISSYYSQYCPAAMNLYMEADTDNGTVWSYGYWYS